MNFWSLQEQVFLDQLSYRHFKEDSASRNSYSCMRTVRGERTWFTHDITSLWKQTYLNPEVRPRVLGTMSSIMNETAMKRSSGAPCMLPHSCSPIAWVLSSDYVWRRPYTITTMIGLEVVHWGFFQEGWFLSRVCVLFEGEEVHWGPHTGTQSAGLHYPIVNDETGKNLLLVLQPFLTFLVFIFSFFFCLLWMKARGRVTDVPLLLLYLHTSICAMQNWHKSIVPTEQVHIAVRRRLVFWRFPVRISVGLPAILKGFTASPMPV